MTDLDYRQKGDWVIIDLVPEINYEVSLILKRTLESLCEKGKTKIAVNMHGVNFIGSLALGVFSFGKKLTADYGGEFCMLQPGRLVLETMASTRMSSVIPTYASEASL